MPANFTDRMELVQTALGQLPFDKIVYNIKIMNVFTEKIVEGSLGIKCGRIVSTQADPQQDAGEKMNGDGLFAIPGLIDTHVHIDSTLLTPVGLAEIILPHGTTTLLADAMEIANVAGIMGLQALFQDTVHLPYHIFLEIPSRVPTAPGLETTGGEIDLDDVLKLLEWDNIVSLGELDPSKIIGLKEEYFKKIAAAYQYGKIANGHAIGLEGKSLDAYAAAGLADDHECVTFEEAQERVSRGMKVFIREGSSERNLEELVKGLVESGCDTRHWMFCTDDKHPNEIAREGHIDYMINKSIQLGLNPLKAIQMGTINAAEHFHLAQDIGSISPGRWADFILTKEIERVDPIVVFHKGDPVVQDGSFTVETQRKPYPETLYRSVHIRRGREAKDYRIDSQQKAVKCKVIELIPDQIINRATIENLLVVEGAVQRNPEKDIIKLAVVERYGINGNIGIGFVKGFNLQRGAISSTVAHDHHNIVIAGADDLSMATCVKKTEEIQGGLVIALDDQVLDFLPLPLGGLMSEEPTQVIIRKLDQLNETARQLGCSLAAPFMTLSFISLPTVPDLGLTDKGLIDVSNHQIIPLLLD